MIRAAGKPAVYREVDWAMTKRSIGWMATATAIAVSVALLVVLGGGQVRAATIVVTTLADENGTNPAACSLREAIAAAGSDLPVGGCPTGAGADIIVFGVGGTIALDPNLGSLIVSSGVLTIQGPGAGGLTIDGSATVQLLRVAAGVQLTLTGLTLANGRTSVDGGAIHNSGSLTITSSTLIGNAADHYAGAIYNAGTGILSITGSTLSGNTSTGLAAFGGFVGAIFNNGVLTVASSTLSGNQANFGGALYHRVDIPTSTYTITDSTFTGNAAASRGGAIGNEFNLSGPVTVTTSTFTGNRGANGGAIHNFGRGMVDIMGGTFHDNQAGNGGAILNDRAAALTLTSSTLSGNSATVDGGAIKNFDGGTVDITGGTFSGNRAAFGGAIHNQSATLTLTSSNLSGNTAAQLGGAILNDRGATATITSSALSGNGADLTGGAIYNSLSGRVTVDSSTFGGNTAGEVGGAIASADAGAMITITNGTFSSNNADVGGAIFASSGTVALTSSTFGGNQSSTGVLLQEGSATFSLHNIAFANPAPSCAGAGQYADLGGNISADASCPFTEPSSQTNTDPLLGPLQNNGGPTQTMALLPGSPAIDAGVGCPPPDTDQRGVTRPQGAACDSGAYELAQISVTLTGSKSCTRTSVTTANCTLALTINPPTTGTNTLTVTTDTGAFGEVMAAGSPATCTPGVVSATGPATVTLPAGCSGVTLSETLRDLPVGAMAVTQAATLEGPDSATGAFTATLGTAPPPTEEILGFRQAAGLRLSCPPLAAVRQIVTCTVVPVDAAGNAVATAPGVIEVSSLAGGLVTARGTRSTNLRFPCGGPVQTPPTPGTPIDPNTCQGVTFQIASTAVGVVEVRVRYEPGSAPAAAGIDEQDAVATVTFVPG